MTKSILNHPQFSKEDYTYLKEKGYNNKEIINIWNKEIGKNDPVSHNFKIPTHYNTFNQLLNN